MRACLLAVLLPAGPAGASFLSGETLDAAANVISWAVLVLVPVIGITLFWIVHVLPEKIAHRRHHPQTKAIQTLCLLSLAFGGLLWPIAWLWAYTKPVAHKGAYGTDKSDEYFTEALALAREGKLDDHQLAELEAELDAMQKRSALPSDLRRAWAETQASRARPAAEAGGA
ncbi:MAG TPA: DUF3302 domain-containing protein [Casimicrobiaceae bacterium]|nr:DUF3302 domain-containing protein [Casimicrobiaceae bacterium]